EAARTRYRHRAAPAAGLAAVAVASVGLLLVLLLGGSSAHVVVPGDSVALISPAGARVAGRFSLGGTPTGVAVGIGAAWVLNADGSVLRIDPASNRIAQTFRDLSATAVASGEEGTWVLERDGTIAELGADSDRVVQSLQTPGGLLTSIAVGGGAVWATDPADG